MAATKTKKKTGVKKKAVRKKAARKKSVRKAATKRKAGRPKGSVNKKKSSGGSLSRMSTSELSAELARRARRLPMLKRQQADLLRKLDAVEAQIAAIGDGGGAGASRGRRSAGRPVGSGVGRKRPRNAMKLEDALAKTLKGKTMSVTEATRAVKAGGYKTTAANFRTIVNATLLKSKKIKKVSRGQYTAK